jgi:hypothetical protein
MKKRYELQEIRSYMLESKKKSATYKQLGVAEASSISECVVSWASFNNRDVPDLIELFSNSSSLLCLKYVLNLINQQNSQRLACALSGKNLQPCE